MTRRSFFYPLLLLVLALAALPLNVAQAQSNIGFGPAAFENHFPHGLTFQIHAQSSAGKIVSARLHYYLRNDPSITQVNVKVVPAYALDLSYTWNTSRQTTPPGAPVISYWEIELEDGSRARSPEALFYYDDPNYNWETLENEQVAVWWHGRPQAFGQQVFDIARTAIASQSRLFGAELDEQVRIIIYNDFNEFAAWHNFIGEFVGGQAFPELAITTQIVPDAEDQEWWLYQVIPHETSHLYFYQVTRNPMVDSPSWLNEGVAQYNEFVEHGEELAYVEDVIWEGGLLRLQSISGSFGNVNAEQVRLAYAESLSAVTYLVETYGTEGLSALLAAYKNGKNTEKAFSEALGVTPGQFEDGWLVWLGIPEGLYPSPTPFPTLKSIPTANLVYQTRTPTAALEETPATTATPASSPPTQAMPPPALSPRFTFSITALLWTVAKALAAGLMLAGVVVLWVILKRRR